MKSAPWPAIEADITRAIGRSFRGIHVEPTGGGCINQTFVARTGQESFFVKVNRADRRSMFQAEAEGLSALSSTGKKLRVPQPICSGTDDAHAWLVLEYINLRKQGDQSRLGIALADLHRTFSAQFGWHRDNTIGATEQINTPSKNWCTFFCNHRLSNQLERARKNGFARNLQDLGDRLLERLPEFLHGHDPRPSLLHGDLWNGNFAFDENGVPAIFDPAVYFGDRETDLAMTELFGGFSTRFYQAYNEQWPLDAGYARRKHLYNLYHILNHLNLFGGAYLSQAEQLMERLLAE